MRRTSSMILLTALMALCLTAMAFAQENMTGNKPQMTSKMSPDNTKAMMMKMSENYQAMEKNLAELEQHMQSMMKIENQDKLRGEMKKHMEMMKSMNMMMGQQNSMCQMMAGVGETGHMHKMDPATGKTMEIKEKTEQTSKEKTD